MFFLFFFLVGFEQSMLTMKEKGRGLPLGFSKCSSAAEFEFEEKQKLTFA